MMIRAARPDEAPQLSALARRSKAVWGYSTEFIAACREELSVDEALILSGRVFVAELPALRLAGFASFTPLSAERYDLRHLFVDPAALRQGVGRALLGHVAVEARGLGARWLEIQGDPNAVAFYQACGAVHIGELESDSIPGRMLPLFELSVHHHRLSGAS